VYRRLDVGRGRKFPGARDLQTRGNLAYVWTTGAGEGTPVGCRITLWQRRTSPMRRAVYAGSFDPITLGHVWMIEQGRALFDHLTVAIGINPDKRYRFSLEERLAMLREVTAGFENVAVASYENMFLVRYAEQIGAGFILRGVRNEQDYAYER